MDFRQKLFIQLQRTTLLDQVVDQCGVIVLATDLHGDVLMADGGGLRELGVLPGDLVGKNVRDTATHPSRWADGLAAVTNGKKRVSFLVDSGESKHVETFGPMLSPAGRVVGVLSITTKVEYGS
jgi:hypothetical protein